MNEFVASLNVEQSKDLLVFLRKAEKPLPRSLAKFEKDLEAFAANFLTLDEAKKIFGGV